MLIRGNVSSKKDVDVEPGHGLPESNTWLFNDSHPGPGKRRVSGVPDNISDEYGVF